MAREIFREATGFYRVEVTADMIGWVEQRLANWKPANFKPMMNQERGTRAGLLGEAIFHWAVERSLVSEYYAPYDFMLDGFSVEVKTHITRHPPHKGFLQLIATEKIKSSDTYAFVSLHDSMQFGWLLGWLMTKEVKAVGSFKKRGGFQEGTHFQYKCDCYEISYDRFRPFNSIRLTGR